MPYHILISDPLPEEGLEKLYDAKDIEVLYRPGIEKEQLLDLIADMDGLIVRSQTQVTAEVLHEARKLKVIGRAGVGVDNIDLSTATALGIVVINAPDGNTISTAEHTFSMLCSLSRRIPQAYHTLKQHIWDRKSFVGVELYGKTLGIIGLGKIGAEVAKRAKAFHMKVIAYDPYLTQEQAEKLGIQKGSLEAVISSGDYITVHTPLLKETHHLISDEQFEMMKDGTYILNCARGGIIDEEALYRAITENKVAGAALDVFEEEPAADHPLLELPQVIATPHLGASTKEAQQNVAQDVSVEMLKVLHDEPFKNAVNLPSVPAHVMNKISPYLDLAEKIGSFNIQLIQGGIDAIHVTYAGEITEFDVSPLTRNVLKGILSHHLGEQVNHVNAHHLAKERHITVNEQKTSSSRGFTNLITLKIVSDDQQIEVWGTLLNGYGVRIVKVEDYSIDLPPTGHILYIRHHDRPGAIGRVGTLLGTYDVNIATMQVGRSDIGGEAIMMLTVDKPVPVHVQSQLAELDEINTVTEIDL